MSDNNYEYTISELLEEAKNDPDWEPETERRAEIVKQMYTSLMNA